ncbi:unnamed protein product [Dovyalis caffra]|uniref:Uncharacterized protein n=1 Tax=Dovyalis caffra TaxID=77055 RepID=A0AAV1RHA9_9ROSI|nr:unnamed protein product [Dovyalis caffra]
MNVKKPRGRPRKIVVVTKPASFPLAYLCRLPRTGSLSITHSCVLTTSVATTSVSLLLHAISTPVLSVVISFSLDKESFGDSFINDINVPSKWQDQLAS